ncbi:hypothetical protein ACFX12_011179 [Malus domestica]
MATRHTWYILSSKQEYDSVTGTLERNVLLPSWAAKGPLNVESKIYWTGGTNWVGPQQLSNWKFETENPKPTTVRERAVTATISCLVKQQPWRFSAKRITGHPVPGTKLTSQSGSQTNEYAMAREIPGQEKVRPGSKRETSLRPRYHREVSNQCYNATMNAKIIDHETLINGHQRTELPTV